MAGWESRSLLLVYRASKSAEYLPHLSSLRNIRINEIKLLAEVGKRIAVETVRARGVKHDARFSCRRVDALLHSIS